MLTISNPTERDGKGPWLTPRPLATGDYYFDVEMFRQGIEPRFHQWVPGYSHSDVEVIR
jgi:hypothetical protein